MASRNPTTRKTKAEKFPLTIRAGSSSVKIYRESRPDGSVYFKLSYHLGGKRHRPSFANLDEAKNEANAKAAQLSRGDIDAMQLNGKDRLAYGRALEAVRQFNIPLDAAAIDYAEVRKVLGNHSLMEAARFYMRHNAAGIMGKPVAEAFEAFRKTKEDAGRNAHYLRVDIGSRCGAFAKAFKMEVRQLTPRDVDTYLNDLQDLKGQTVNKHADALGTFFKFCQSRQWLSKEINLLEHFESRREQHGEIKIFTSAELRLLLDAADPEFATCIALQAFAGVRSEELQKLTWEDLAKRDGHIEVAASKAKTASRRVTPISDNLAAWLEDAPKTGKLVWPHRQQSFYEQQEATVKAAQVAENKRHKKTPKEAKTIKWKHNALRHSFISYRVAETQNMNQVALETGTSVKKIVAHYRELVTPKEAKEWFGIVPATRPKNIVEMAA
jgi:integrase